MFYDVIRTMIALACVLAILGGILPGKQNTALRLLIGMLVLTSVLSAVRALGSIPLTDPLRELEQAQQKGEQNMVQQTLELAKQRIEQDVTQLCETYTGASPRFVTVQWAGEGENMEVGLLSVGIRGSAGQLEQVLQERYQPRQLVVEEE